MPPASSAAPERVGLHWLATVRWATLVACVGAIVAGRSGLDGEAPVAAASIVLGVFAASNLWLTWNIRRLRATPANATAGLLISADVVLLSWLLLSSGGVLNPASVFYLVQIVVAALVLGTAWTWIVTALCVAGYATLFLGQSDRLVAAQGMHPEIALHMRGMWLAFAATSLIVGILVTRLAVAVERRDRALDALRERNAKASRVAGLATVVAGAAHELGTPLATMAVAARELERAMGHVPNADELRADTKLIRSEIDRCRRVLDEMAGRIAEPMGEAPRTARVDDVLSEAVARLPSQERARIDARVPDDLRVTWPAGVVSRALANLLQNATQASAPGQRVEAVASVGADDRVRIEIIDRGHGMSRDELARAGEPFFTTKPQGVGTGLGLFVARSAIEQLGGALDLTSTPAKGTKATIVLPRDVTIRM